MNKDIITNIEQLPKELGNQMCLPFIVEFLGKKTTRVNCVWYQVSDDITLEQLHKRYYKKPVIDNRFDGVKQTWEVNSTGKRPAIYLVKQDGIKFTCTCKVFMFLRDCKHVIQIKNELKIKIK